MANGLQATSVAFGLLVNLTSAYPVEAAVLIFECTSTQTYADGTSAAVKSRVEIVPASLDYLEYHYYGNNPQLISRGKLLELTHDRVTFSDDTVMMGYIDRTNGNEYWTDKRHGTEERGVCKEGR